MTVTGTLTPTPVFALNGADVAAGPSPDGTWPPLMALDGAVVKWGRAAVTEQPTPATATVLVFDPSGVWAAGLELVGQPVTLRWTSGATTRIYFRGRVAAVELERTTVRDPDGNTVDGARVTLSCTSLLVDLANRKLSPGWFAETVAARRANVATAVAGPVSSVATAATWDTAQVFASADNDTALAALGKLYDSAGADRFSYDPDSRAVTAVPRRTYSNPEALAYLTRDPSRVGAFITSPGGWIDGGAVTAAQKASKDQESRLTRATVGYYKLNGAGTGYDQATLTRTVTGADEAVVGERALSVDTGLIGATAAGQLADSLAAVAAGEASGWRLEPMRWDTRLTGGFETLAQASLLLAGAETGSVHFLAGTWLPDLGIRPVFGVMGGSIVYRKQGWAVEWQPAPIGVTAAQPYVLTWDHIDNGAPANTLVWDDEPNPDGIHQSVTYEDLRFVSYGLGVTTIPTDGA